MDEQKSVEVQIEKLILEDDWDELMSFLKSGVKHACDFSPSKLLKLICKHSARRCVNELLRGKANFRVDANMELEGGLFPLQLAAESLTYFFTSDLLDCGAQPNVVFDEHGSKDLTKLPLNFALQAISDQCASYWSPEKSVYKLLYIFCLPHMEEALNTAGLLSHKTEDVENLALYYVEEGKVVQLAALLLCDLDRFIPRGVEDAENTIVGQHILTQLARLHDQELVSMLNCGPCCPQLETLYRNKINLMACLKFAKIVNIAGDVIYDYRGSYFSQLIDNEDVPYAVAHELLENTDLVLRLDDVISDDIECLKIKFTAKEKALVLDAIEKRMQSWSMQSECKTRDIADQAEACFPKESFVKSMTTPAALVDERRRVGGGGGRCCTLLSLPSLTTCLSYHTWGDVSMVDFRKPVERHMPRSSQPEALVFLRSANICSRLVLCAKRFVK